MKRKYIIPKTKELSSIYMSSSILQSSGGSSASGVNNLGGGTGTDNRDKEEIEGDDGDALVKGRGFYSPY